MDSAIIVTVVKPPENKMRSNLLWEKADELFGQALRIVFGGMVLWVLLHLDSVIPAVRLAFTSVLPE